MSDSDPNSSQISEDHQEFRQNKKWNDPKLDQEDSASSSRSSSNLSSEEEIQLNDQQKLEQEILNEIAEHEKLTPFQKEITAEIEDKMEDFRGAVINKSGEELVTIRIQELVFAKLLVLTYGKSDFRLVVSHYHLGHAYLGYDCIEQAIEHTSLAMHKNQKLFGQLPKTQLFQTYMQNTLAQGLMQKGSYEDAIDLLGRSIELEEKVRHEQNNDEEEDVVPKNIKAMTLLAQCHCKIKEFKQALSLIDEVIEIVKDSSRLPREEEAFALAQKASILADQESHSEAINCQEEAIGILIKENYSKPEEVAEMYSVLAGYHQKMGNNENALNCIQKVKTLYQELYSGEDKRVIKARRKIATNLLKCQRYKQAINELLEIVELEEKVFGENSMQTARTLKLLGTVYINLETGDARTYLKRSMHIFQTHGNKKQVQEIKNKLKSLITHAGSAIEAKLISEQDL